MEKSSLLVLGVAALLTCSCSKREPDPEHAIRFAYVQKLALAEDAGAVWRLTSNDEIFFDDGWAPIETERGVRSDAWRWMGRYSLMRLKNHDRRMRVAITGWVPLHLLGAAPTMTLRWNGVRVDAFIAPAGRFTRTIVVEPGMQQGGGWSDFVVETSTVGSERGDPRELGFAIAEMRWEPAEP